MSDVGDRPSTGYGVRRGADPEVPALERITLSSPEGLEVAFVPRAGMVGTSMSLDGVELLGRRTGLAAYLEKGSTYGIPLLAPWANRLRAVEQSVDGADWEVRPGTPGVHVDENGLAIHGLLAGFDGFEVEELVVGGDRAVLRARLAFGAHLDRFASFPFPHDLVVEAEVWGTTLTLRTSLTATGSVAVPVAFGWHPYVAFPDTPRAQWTLDAPFTRNAVLSELFVPTGEVVDVAAASGPLGTTAYDDVFVDVRPSATVRVAGVRHAVSFDYVGGYPVAVLYAPLTHDLVAVEPMTAPTDPFSGRWPIRLAQPGETVTAVFDMTAHRLAP
jgi:galactose mutarotase-like enzyme